MPTARATSRCDMSDIRRMRRSAPGRSNPVTPPASCLTGTDDGH
jgi:hypothetical protein